MGEELLFPRQGSPCHYKVTPYVLCCVCLFGFFSDGQDLIGNAKLHAIKIRILHQNGQCHRRTWGLVQETILLLLLLLQQSHSLSIYTARVLASSTTFFHWFQFCSIVIKFLLPSFLNHLIRRPFIYFSVCHIFPLSLSLSLSPLIPLTISLNSSCFNVLPY